MTLKRIYDALKKSKLLKDIYDKTRDMNLETKNIFETAIDCLFYNKQELAKDIGDEDKKINKYEINIREDILTYLAINTAPDLGTSLILTSVVISYERIGDYCKSIANLGLLYPCELDKDEYRDITFHMCDTIKQQFDLTAKALAASDAESAKTVIETYNGIKTLHDAITEKLNKDKNIDINKAITYASLSIYLRRISAHLKNISTTVLAPFPEIGFEKKIHHRE